MRLLSVVILLGLAIISPSATAQGIATDPHDNRTVKPGKPEQAEPPPQAKQIVTAPPSSCNPAQEQIVSASSFPKWEEPVIKGVAEGGLALVSLGFAAFTFLYGALLSLRVSDEETDDRLKSLKTKLRRALYNTAVAVVLSAFLSVLAFVSVALERHILGFVAIALTIVVLVLLSGITGYLAFDVYREGRAL